MGKVRVGGGGEGSASAGCCTTTGGIIPRIIQTQPEECGKCGERKFRGGGQRRVLRSHCRYCTSNHPPATSGEGRGTRGVSGRGITEKGTKAAKHLHFMRVPFPRKKKVCSASLPRLASHTPLLASLSPPPHAQPPSPRPSHTHHELSACASSPSAHSAAARAARMSGKSGYFRRRDLRKGGGASVRGRGGLLDLRGGGQ